MYKLTTIEGYSLSLDQEEAETVTKAINAGMKTIAIQGNLITVSNITGMWKDNLKREHDDEHEIGVLHDGSRAIRRFGAWYALSNQDAKIDPAYYPEVAMDVVPSVQEWEEKYASIGDREQVKRLMCGERGQRYIEQSGGMTGIAEVAQIFAESL
jgi:hypothetical protein